MNGFLLIVTLAGFPNFILPFPDFETCRANEQAMEYMIGEKAEARALCFDLKHQAIAGSPPPRASAPPQGERVE